MQCTVLWVGMAHLLLLLMHPWLYSLQNQRTPLRECSQTIPVKCHDGVHHNSYSITGYSFTQRHTRCMHVLRVPEILTVSSDGY